MASREVSINLIGEEEMAHTPVGRIVSWAVTYGRYIMIGTEVVVLLAFISRFSLDRKLTDLNDDVSQKQAIIEANLDFEQQFRQVQNQILAAGSLIGTPSITLSLLDTLQAKLPKDARLETLVISGTKIVGNGTVQTPASLSYIVNLLQTTPPLTQVDIGDVKRSIGRGIEFQFTASLANTKKK